MIRILMLISTLLIISIAAELQPIEGTHCSPNQVVTKLTVYDDGAIEAECNKLPCGISGVQCRDAQTSCKADSDTFSGMKWAVNGQSVLLRCCSLDVANKIYVGTDLVSLGSYYTGGLVEKKDLYGKDGPEYDFISNIRTEQGGVRVWVYRVMCTNEETKEQRSNIADGRSYAFEKRRQYLLKQMSDRSSHNEPEVALQEDEAPEQVTPAESKPRNPLQYRPTNYRRHPATTSAHNPTGRLL